MLRVEPATTVVEEANLHLRWTIDTATKSELLARASEGGTNHWKDPLLTLLDLTPTADYHGREAWEAGGEEVLVPAVWRGLVLLPPRWAASAALCDLSGPPSC